MRYRAVTGGSGPSLLMSSLTAEVTEQHFMTGHDRRGLLVKMTATCKSLSDFRTIAHPSAFMRAA